MAACDLTGNGGQLSAQSQGVIAHEAQQLEMQLGVQETLSIAASLEALQLLPRVCSSTLWGAGICFARRVLKQLCFDIRCANVMHELHAYLEHQRAEPSTNSHEQPESCHRQQRTLSDSAFSSGVDSARIEFKAIWSGLSSSAEFSSQKSAGRGSSPTGCFEPAIWERGIVSRCSLSSQRCVRARLDCRRWLQPYVEQP